MAEQINEINAVIESLREGFARVAKLFADAVEAIFNSHNGKTLSITSKTIILRKPLPTPPRSMRCPASYLPDKRVWCMIRRTI